MRTIVTFESDAFNTTETKENYINPENYGDDVCAWLSEELMKAGVTVDGDPGQEDFGWYMSFGLNSESYCLVCANRNGDEDDPPMWIMWIEKNVGFLKSIFGQREKSISADAVSLVDKVLKASDKIRNVRWHEKKAFESGKEEEGKTDPLSQQ